MAGHAADGASENMGRLQSRLFRGDPVLEDTLNNRRTIRRGSRGEPVRKIQQALIELGHPLPRFGADGRFGAETDGAVRSFQREQAIQVDGIVGPVTMGRLDDAMLAREVPTGPPITPVVNPVRPEDGGPLVRAAIFDDRSSETSAVSLSVVGDGFLDRAAPIVARLGDQKVESILLQADGQSFSGSVRRSPRPGDQLFVGYGDTALSPTGISFPGPSGGGGPPVA